MSEYFTPQDSAAYIYNLRQNAGFGDTPEAEADIIEFRGYQSVHADYLSGIVDSVLKRGKSYHVIAEEFDATHSSAFIRTKLHYSLDLATLGLPELDLGNNRMHSRPVAIIAHDLPERVKPGTAMRPVGSLELVLISDDDRLSRLYLENPDEVMGKGGSEPKWISPGNVTLVSDDTDVAGKVSGARDMHDWTMLTLKAEPNFQSNRAGTARIIRVQPTTIEQRAATGQIDKRPVSKLKKTLIGIGAASMLSTLLPHDEDPIKNHPLNSASQDVLSAGSTKDSYGIPQAEQYFDAKTLSRSRDAIAAYLRGDTKALKQQVEANHYDDDWVSPEAFETLQDAQDSAGLEKAFDAITGKIPVTLNVANTQARVNEIGGNSIATPTHDFAEAKQLAVASMQLLNMLSKTQLENLPLELPIYIVGKSSDDARPEDGYYSENIEGGSNTIVSNMLVLTTTQATGAASLIAHEGTHWLSTMTSMVDEVNGLDAPSHQYTGGDYTNTSKTVDGWDNVVDLYGNYQSSNEDPSDEDTATNGQRLLVLHPKQLILNESYANEKQSAVLFSLEQYMPGSTAAILARMSPYKQASGPSELRQKWYKARKLDGLLDGGGAVIIAAVALNITLEERRRRQIKRHMVKSQQIQ